MKFTIVRSDSGTFRDSNVEAFAECCKWNGDTLVERTDEANYILNFTDPDNPKSVRRQSRSVFVITFAQSSQSAYNEKELKSTCYNSLVRSLSNLYICMTQGLDAYFTTPEAGFFSIYFDPQKIYEQMSPIIHAHFATDNHIVEDLPERLHNGSSITESICHFGKVLDQLGVLPVPFRLKGFLSQYQIDQLYKIYGITGASYGNLSARERVHELGDRTFWMTGRGVDKSNLSKIGKDIILVKDFDYDKGEATLSMPPVYDPKARVSVDAVEHSMIYETLPGVGAIIHVHAWIPGVNSTRQNYPCGTVDLAEEVLSLLLKEEEPVSAAVGLKNHGLTITGRNLKEIFEKFSHKLLTEVEMFA